MAADAAPRDTIETALVEDGTVLRILLNRPKGNVLNAAMMGAISDALAAHRDAAHLRLVLVRGAGGNFSFGASVEEHRRDQAPGMLQAFHRFVRAIATHPVPVAALVEGRCLGGAFEMTLACHLVFATNTARFGCPEIKLGVFPPVLAVAGFARLGGALAERLLLTGEEIDAAAAERAGFLAAVFDADTDPEAAVLAWYRKHLRPLSALAVREAVRAGRTRSPLLAALGEPLDEVERQYVERTLASHDGNEGIEAFLARRSPVWTDT
jgi:cyclohexa-1,5-dienecarbonyl-CoA hydratase